MAGPEAELAEEQSRRREAEERAQTEQQSRQEAERRATHLAREKQEAERNNQILRSEKAGKPCNNSSNKFFHNTDYSTAVIEESERRQSELGEQVREATQRAVQAENRARDGERQVSEANNRVRELEGEMGQLQDQLQESEAAVREREERLGEVEGRLAETERELREGERRRRQAEERVRDMEERVRTAVERQRGAEERMIEAEASEQLALHRTQQAENRLRQETQQRMQCERQIEQLEAQLREAQRAAEGLQGDMLAQGEEVFWRVERREIHLSQRELGRGGWAEVKVAEFRGLQVAAKCLHSIIISEHNRQLFQREMNIAARLRHPHLVQFIGATLEGEPVILTELMSTSLRDVLGRGGLREAQITTIGRHVALALNYMHQITPDPILHRDVSSANVLLNPAAPERAWVAKLSDYGSANFTRLVSTAGPGNPSYAAPEASNPAQQSPKMDVFSFGVLLLEMATAQFPNRDNLAVQMRGITLPRLQQLVRRCINDNPTRRPTISVVLGQL